jgi:hypothetical protein
MCEEKDNLILVATEEEYDRFGLFKRVVTHMRPTLQYGDPGCGEQGEHYSEVSMENLFDKAAALSDPMKIRLKEIRDKLSEAGRNYDFGLDESITLAKARRAYRKKRQG